MTSPVVPAKLKLQSNDQEIFEVSVEAAMRSNTIKEMLDNLGMDNDPETDETIPVPNVNGVILRKVIDWVEYHKDDPVSADNNDETDDDDGEKHQNGKTEIGGWDAEFLNVDQNILFEMILAANYLDIKGLLKLTCRQVTNLIRGKSTDEIRRTFNIKNDLTPEQEIQIRKENEWCEEK